ncbi:MAG: acyltransferase [Thalassotalea sp.]
MLIIRKFFRYSGMILIESTQTLRRFYFLMCSLGQCRSIKKQPILAYGRGKIKVGKNVDIGLSASPGYLSTYCYLEARQQEASIVICDNVKINNGFSAISNTASIFIGENTLIGLNVQIVDSDFHRVSHFKRGNNDALSESVNIGKNVFIANDVKIYKGVKIGNGAVVGAGSVVLSDVCEHSIVHGNPAKFIKMISYV